MQKSGVIAANVALWNPKRSSATITSIVDVLRHDESAVQVDATKALFRDTPEVQQCDHVAGGSSFVLIFVAPDMRRYERLTRRRFAENASARSSRSLMALDQVKAGATITIQA